MAATLNYQVTVPAPAAATPQFQAGYRLQVTVTAAVGMDNRPFVFQRQTPSAGAGMVGDTFYSVASAGQLLNLPPDAATPPAVFYRRSSLDLVFDNLHDLQEARAGIELLLGELVRAINALDELAAPVAVSLS